VGSYAIAYLLYALGQASLAIWAFRLLRKEHSAAALTLLLPPAAVVYDNLMIALGSYIGAGPLLQVLTVPRFAGHALITPIWIVTAVSFALRAGAFTRRKRGLTLAAWILYGIMVVIGLLNEVVFYAGELVTEGDVLYYTNIGRLFTPPPPSLTMLLVVLLCGAVVLWHTRWPWMLLGSIPVLLSQALRTEAAAFVFINSGEVIMSASLVLTLVFLRKREAGIRLSA
jgi:hypothetical protein